MKKPLIALTLMVVLVALALIFSGRKPETAPAPADNSTSTHALPSPAAANLTVITPTSASSAQKTTVAIQDGKTLDFSSGKPVLKDSAEEKAIIEQSVKEMNEAAAGVTFGPVPKTPAPK